MLLHFILSQNGILNIEKWPNGLQLDLSDIRNILIALERAQSIAFLTEMHNCNAIDIPDPCGKWKNAARDLQLPFLTIAADRLSDQKPIAQIMKWLTAFTKTENLDFLMR